MHEWQKQLVVIIKLSPLGTSMGNVENASFLANGLGLNLGVQDDTTDRDYF